MLGKTIRIISRLKKSIKLKPGVFKNNRLLSSKVLKFSKVKVGVFTTIGICAATELNSEITTNQNLFCDEEFVKIKFELGKLKENIMMDIHKYAVGPVTNFLKGIASFVDMLCDSNAVRNLIILCYFPLLPMFVFDCCMQDEEFFGPIELYKKHLLTWLFCVSFVFCNHLNLL